jgi:hypothetical protein
MLKIFSFRITPFFLFIVAMQSLALLISLYVGVVLYQDTTLVNASGEIVESAVYSGLFLIVLLSILTPTFFYQTKVISYVKKTIHDKTSSFIIAAITMLIVLLINGSSLDTRMFFVAALVSGGIGILVGQFGLLGKYWRCLVRSGMN